MRDVFWGIVNKSLSKYTVHFKGLKQGEHIFNFDVDDAFFNAFEGSEISRANVGVKLNFLKHSNMLELHFAMSGNVEVACDRCLERFFIPITYNGVLFVRITDSIPEEENIDDVWYLNSNDHEIDLAQYIYESICLSLPIQRYHGILNTSEEDCDKVMVEKLNSLTVNDDSEEEQEYDSRWDKLKDLLKN